MTPPPPQKILLMKVMLTQTCSWVQCIHGHLDFFWTVLVWGFLYILQWSLVFLALLEKFLPTIWCQLFRNLGWTFSSYVLCRQNWLLKVQLDVMLFNHSQVLLENQYVYQNQSTYVLYFTFTTEVHLFFK